jgi:hypothetical protein
MALWASATPGSATTTVARIKENRTDARLTRRILEPPKIGKYMGKA